ncbi:EI24 domain-containing protein [Bordetella sp. FB-8]|uniref:EI24 domain-containing protein n=1 Tax=Bordetella sp. FB-8 TaxID=1159870 RepID=UPI0004756B90|nr:EI24 domain-containing protein [Bordetella sp. FB-8]
MVFARRSASPPPDAYAAVARAFKRALVSQCHPSMLFAVLLPLLIALVGAVLMMWLFWMPLTDWLRMELARWGAMERVDDWLATVGMFSLKVYLTPIIAAAILLPVSGVLGLAIAAVFVMPLVLRHLERGDYAGLARQGRNALAVSVWNAFWVSLVFAAGWLLTLPLWLVPPMAIVLHVAWWAFAFSRMLRVDAIVDHASPAERRLLLARHNLPLWGIGIVCALINLLPPAWVVLPVYGSLVYAHYGLDALARLRDERTIDV